MKKKTVSLIILTALVVAALLTGCTGKEQPVQESGTAHTDDAVSTEEVYVPKLPTEVSEADIYVEKIDGLPEDFIKGMDISSLLVEEASGVKYYDENGEEQDLMRLLADAGLNYVRVRVWNDPFDENGNGYGGGNCTAASAAEIGARAAKYGMKLCVDFHYSDFWADPSKQMSPKAWKDMNGSDKAAALKEYTKNSLNQIIDAGADVGLVQVGNETNNGIAGERALGERLQLLKVGCQAVHDVAAERGLDIKAVVHYTQVDDAANTLKIASELDAAKVEYDVFGISYYPYWHGTMDNMIKVLKDIESEYGVATCIMETSYPYTTEDGDGSGNSVSGDELSDYPVSVQGQANAIRDIMAAANSAGAIGLFYWEGAWIPVGSNSSDNSKIWEEYGSGWASSYAGAYDPDDAGRYYGGCSWDNQAMFDFSGKILDSLNVFKYVNYGAKGKQLEVVSIEEAVFETPIGGELLIPEELKVTYNDSSCKVPMKVTWDERDIASIDSFTAGVYELNGKGSIEGIDGEFDIKGSVRVAAINYVDNPDFEGEDASMWKATYKEGKDPTDIQNKSADAHGGDRAFHFYRADEFEFDATQNITDIPEGKYSASAFLQGGDVGSDSDIYMFVTVNGETFESDKIEFTGWQQWKNAVIEGINIPADSEVTIGFHVKSGPGGWGTIDDVELSLSN